MLAHSGFEFRSGPSDDGYDIEVDFTGVVETVDGSIEIDAGVFGLISGDVIAKGTDSDVTLHAARTMKLSGLVQAERDVAVTAGTNVLPGEQSILTEPSALLRSVGGGGKIHIEGLNDVHVNSSVGPGSTGLALTKIVSKEGFLLLDKEGGRIETAGEVELSAGLLELAGVVKVTADIAASAFDFRVLDSEEIVLSGDVSAVGSVKFTAEESIVFDGGTLAVTGSGGKIHWDSQGDVVLGGFGYDADGKRIQLGGVIQAPGEILLTAGESFDMAPAVKVLTTETDSLLKVSASSVAIAGTLLAGATDVSDVVTWTGESSDLRVHATEQVIIGGRGVDGTGALVARGGSLSASGELEVKVTGGANSDSLDVSALSNLMADAAKDALTAASGASAISILTDHDARIHGLVESIDNGSDVTIQSGGQLLVGGLVRAEDALLVKGGESPTGISFVLTPIVNETDDDGDEINAAGNKVSASGGDPVRKSGGVLDVRSGGTITVEGSEDLLLNGMVGRVYVASGSPAVDAVSADITSAAGDVFVTGLVNAKDSVTISARDIFVLNEAVVKTRATGSEAFLKATRKVHVTRSPTATERALVEAGKLVHLFGKELQADGTLKTREADARILLNATDDILVTGEVLASDVAELNSGVASDATRTRLEQGFALSDLSGGDVRIFAEAKIDAVTDVLVVAGGDFRLQAFSELGDGTRSLASPYVSQNAETIDVVTGSRQVEDGTMIVERVEWIDTTVTEEVGREQVKVGFTQKEANVTLAQSGYWKPTPGTSPPTGTFRKFLVDEAGDSLFGGFSGNDTDSAALADFNSATITGLVQHGRDAEVAEGA